MKDNNNSQPSQNTNNNRRPFKRNLEERKHDPSTKEKYSKDKSHKHKDNEKQNLPERTRQMRGSGPNFTHFFSLPLHTSEFKLIAKGFTVSKTSVNLLINSLPGQNSE